jgi:CDP-diacylglycerol--glycerol-3-phosphate 3-phosphatidyltransferase
MTTTLSPVRPPIVNLPNLLTSARFVLAVVLFVLISYQAWLWCLIVFCLAALTDWLDGYLARKQGLTSSLGRNLDPLVDKVLVCGAFIFLLPAASHGLAPVSELAPWMVVVVVGRELIITSLRGYLESQGVVFGADWLGKLKMGLQCAALIAIFVALQAPEADLLVRLSAGLLYAMVGATALSGAQYLWKAFLLLK